MIEIGNKKIGYGYPPILSAELSLNHSGNLKTALQMVDTAAECGADAVKLQYYVTEDFAKPDGEMITYKQGAQKADFDMRNGNLIFYREETTEPIYDLFKRNEINLDFVKACQKRTKEHDLIFHATTTSVQGVKEMAEIGVDAFKVSSDMVENVSMLTEMYKHKEKIPLIVSTGHISPDLITVFQEHPALIFLHCESSYPAENPKLWKIKHMQELRHQYIKTCVRYYPAQIGYSHHGTDWREIVRACECGSVFNEFHFTLDKTQPGSDHHWSLDPTELKKLVEAVK